MEKTSVKIFSNLFIFSQVTILQKETRNNINKIKYTMISQNWSFSGRKKNKRVNRKETCRGPSRSYHQIWNFIIFIFIWTLSWSLSLSKSLFYHHVWSPYYTCRSYHLSENCCYIRGLRVLCMHQKYRIVFSSSTNLVLLSL